MPDFVGIGFQKCGTTTLFDLLAAHPDIALARDVKEPMFYRVPAYYGLYWPWRRKFYAWRYFGHLEPDWPPAGGGGQRRAGLQRLRGDAHPGFRPQHEAVFHDAQPGGPGPGPPLNFSVPWAFCPMM